MTNYERIKNMSVEEMEEFLFDMTDCQTCRATLLCDDNGCKNAVKKYLESEVTNDN